MYSIVYQVHSLCAYVVLAMLTVAVINALIGFFAKKSFLEKDLRISLFTLIMAHIQLLLGVILWLVTPKLLAFEEGMRSVMKDPLFRKLLVEHPLTILIAVTLITIGWSKHKKEQTAQRKFGKIAVFYTFAWVLILSMIPWREWLTWI
ncbi:hypothetical protein SAMN05444369_10533 [Capnocytophaga haemolytica]|uniref:50S ribosomal protein L27 n=1 Tax=Capnocytophaga haemolytica TaxID=45243 RepID=A0AAX2GYY9_9FLAO|nr:hypothetical protein [Capnocytophaga haemolytica]AMD84176.1 hypothetical protein AXF12_00670 [Capnocytophaga haemolytica]SFN93554.1 hypothetical protein SAMN05444369_10533 [Capnocytophaga haemolytica]SNV12860.1 Uncharacterised protein [Capnocytophaga haemolytica]